MHSICVKLAISLAMLFFRQPEMYLLTELVRLLEQRGYTFSTNPQHITEILRQTNGNNKHKLHRRAALIDRDGQLQTHLQTHQRHLRLVLWLASLIWFVFGLTSTYALMQNSSLNFLLLLSSVLGINTVMLLLWLFGLMKRQKTPAWQGLFFSGSRDILAQSIRTLYLQTATQPHSYWTRGQITHRLAFCGLLGMFLSVLLLLLVKQYHFNWESTLLDAHGFGVIVSILAWLPEKLGFATPTQEMIALARNGQQTENAAIWGSLLLGSLLCYGLLPRFLAWIFCYWKRKNTVPKLDLSLPYYQNIIQKWQQKVVDSADDYQADKAIVLPQIDLDTPAEHWAVLLDTPHENVRWFEHALGQDWIDKGILAERADSTNLLIELEKQPVQLLVGVRAHVAPDRGTVRILQKLAQTAKAGLIVQLNAQDETQIHAQWQSVLQQNAWASLTYFQS